MHQELVNELNLVDLHTITDLAWPIDHEKTYYLSGPMSGYPEYNFPAFEEAAFVLRAHGVKVASPHEIDHGETEENRGKLPYETYMEAAIDMLNGQCQGIILLPGWPQSTGARRELVAALEVDMPVYFYVYNLAETDNAILACMNRKPPA